MDPSADPKARSVFCFFTFKTSRAKYRYKLPIKIHENHKFHDPHAKVTTSAFWDVKFESTAIATNNLPATLAAGFFDAYLTIHTIFVSNEYGSSLTSGGF